jgi:hypothetical protein
LWQILSLSVLSVEINPKFRGPVKAKKTAIKLEKVTDEDEAMDVDIVPIESRVCIDNFFQSLVNWV